MTVLLLLGYWLGPRAPILYTLYPIPYTLYTLYTLYPISYTLYPIPYTLHQHSAANRKGLAGDVRAHIRG